MIGRHADDHEDAQACAEDAADAALEPDWAAVWRRDVAYKQTLYGENQEATFAVTLEAEDVPQTGGCTKTAVEHAFTPEELTASYFNQGDAVLEQDPRVVSALTAWSECMRDAGFAARTTTRTRWKETSRRASRRSRRVWIRSR